jgi:hypothetical protein
MALVHLAQKSIYVTISHYPVLNVFVGYNHVSSVGESVF